MTPPFLSAQWLEDVSGSSRILSMPVILLESWLLKQRSGNLKKSIIVDSQWFFIGGDERPTLSNSVKSSFDFANLFDWTQSGDVTEMQYEYEKYLLVNKRWANTCLMYNILALTLQHTGLLYTGRIWRFHCWWLSRGLSCSSGFKTSSVN